jgi:hypothetical protein
VQYYRFQQTKMASDRPFDLSFYEIHRLPQEQITDETEIASLHRFFTDLICPICRGILNKTMVSNCLHRFCYECIVNTLRLNIKKCPTCRGKIVSKRSLRPDTNLDLIISKMYPNGDEYEAYQNRNLAKLHKKSSQQEVLSISSNDRNSGKWKSVSLIFQFNLFLHSELQCTKVTAKVEATVLVLVQLN